MEDCVLPYLRENTCTFGHLSFFAAAEINPGYASKLTAVACPA